MIYGSRFERSRVRVTIFCFAGSVHRWRAGPTVQFLEGRGTLTLSLLNCGSIHSRRIRGPTSETICCPETGESHLLPRLLIN